VGEDGSIRQELALGATPEEAARTVLALPGRLPEGVRRSWEATRPGGPLQVADPGLLGTFEPAEEAPLLPLERRRAIREKAWPADSGRDRAFYLALARARASEMLARPGETLIALAREEERFERAERREAEAAAQFLAGGVPALLEQQGDWDAVREALAAHHARLMDRLERSSRAVAPNLSALVGARVSARLLARAGGLEPLGRMSASRLQLLGSRRRPGPGRSPRFGVLFRADGMDQVPPARQGAFARSLAALAVIAARMDGTDPRERSSGLRARRDRRIAQLRRRAA
jgi:hypothetical protein